MSSSNWCPVCDRFIYSHKPHKCPPCWLVFIGEDSCPDYGKADSSVPSSDENDWVEVYALDESEAAEKHAERCNTEGDYYLMNNTYPVWVRPFPWNPDDKPKRFNVSAEPDINYSVHEVE